MIQYFKTPPHRRRMSRIMWTVGASAILFLLLFWLALTAIRSLTSSLPGADAADRWKADDAPYPYTQLTVYTDSTAAFDLNTIYLHRMNLEQELKENAVSVPEGASAYIDAFSGETTLSVSTERTTLRVNATACGGDFFFFHPFEMLHGDYFSEDDLNAHTVILDEYAAWQLFGAIEVTGMDVTIGNQLFRVAGVCKKPTDPLESTTWGDVPRIFVHYIGLRMTTKFDRADCYEIVMPNPIGDFAHGILSDRFSITEKSTNAVIYDNSKRFSFDTLTKASAEFFMRSIRRDRILPPFWENNNRVTETKAIVTAFFGAIAGITALICAIAFLSLWFWIHPIRITDIWHFFNDKYEARRMKKWLKQQESPLNAPEKTRS